MWGAAAGLPEQVEAAVSAARGLEGLPQHERVENVVVLGMGGSGFAGNVLAAAAAPFMPVPVTVVKGYQPPDYVGTGSLVFAISFSGDTEETVEAAAAAYEAGASLIVVAGGGALVSLAGEWDVPVVPPPGWHPPAPGGARGAGHPPAGGAGGDRAVSRGAAVGGSGGPASSGSAATNWSGPAAVPRSWPAASAGPSRSSTAPRTSVRPRPCGGSAQINENAKTPAFFNVYPELCHNELAGWGQNGDATRQLITLVNLRHDAEHPQVSRRFDLVAEVLREVVADIIEVRAAGEGDLAQLLDLAMIGDFVSLHLAAQEGIDPGPIPVLDELKAQLTPGGH